MAGSVRSAKNLWSLVSGISVLKSKNLIGQELQDNSDWLLHGLCHHKKANNVALEQLKRTVDDAKFDFLSKLSQLLDIDALQCFSLFSSYAKYEYKGTEKNLNALLSSERHLQSLLFELWTHYHNEQMYSLLTMKHILEHWKDDSDPNKDLYDKFLQGIGSDKAITKNMLKQLIAICELELPNKDTHGPFVNETLVHQWVTYALKYQIELLQILLLYNDVIFSSPKEVQHMMSIFHNHCFGIHQPFRHLITKDEQPLVDLIGFLEAVIIVQSFDLKHLLNTKKGKENSDQKIKDLYEVLDNTVRALGSHKPHGPILLSWLFIDLNVENSSSANMSHKFGNTALNLDVFNYIAMGLKATESCQNTGVTRVTHSVIHDMMSLVISRFEINTLGSLQPIHEIGKSVLKLDSIAQRFWDKPEGIGSLVYTYIEKFPLEFHPLLDMLCSISEASESSCNKVIKLMKKLPVFVEHVDNTTMNELVATSEPSVWKLTRSRSIFGDSTLIIPEGTLGVLIPDMYNGQTVIQWHSPINGWQICLWELHNQFRQISQSLHHLTDDSIATLTSISSLVLSLLKTDSTTHEQLVDIIELLFSLLQRLSHHSTPPIEFIAKCINIAAILCHLGYLNAWQQVTQTNFLPSLNGAFLDVRQLTSGGYLSMGTICHLIASNECATRKYPLCIAFLNLTVSFSETLLEESDGSFLACVLYILREILSSFNKWFYIDSQEKFAIGQSCLTLLHNLFRPYKEENSFVKKVHDLCVFSLLHFEAGQALLQIVCTGNSVIQQITLKQNSALGEQIVKLVRLAMSVLNRLLISRHSLTPEKLEQSSKVSASPIEKVLFSMPGQSEQPQVVLTVASYAFQHCNSNLAILAVQLLKRFAKEFPMSLLACFGSEAKAVRDHFLSSLNSPLEDIRLKITILEFLTVCIAVQPGLIEMFINIRDEKKGTSTGKSCLICVKDILKEKLELRGHANYYTQSLLTVALEFVHALWAGHQGLAVEALKQDADFWPLICKSLLNEDLKFIHSKVFAYVIHTLALEFFSMSMSVRSAVFDGGIHQVMNKIFGQDLLLKWSQHVHSINISSTDATVDFDSSVGDHDTEGYYLYTAWRDFLVVIAKYESELHLNIAVGVKSRIMLDILKNLLNQFSSGETRLLILLSESYLMLSNMWKSEFCLNWVETFDAFDEIFTYMASQADPINPRLQLAIVSAATRFVTAHSKSKDKQKLSFVEWMGHMCKMLKRVAILIDQPLREKELASVLKLPIAVICMMNQLVQKNYDWLNVMKSNVTLPLLVSLLTKCLTRHSGIGLAFSIVTFFVSVASIPKVAEALYNTDLMSEVTLILSSVDLESEDKFSMELYGNKITVVSVYYAFLRLVYTLLRTLGNYFIQDALNFVGIHLKNFHTAFNHVKKNLLTANLEGAILTCMFVYQLSFHQSTWLIEHPKSLETLLNDVSSSANAVIAVLFRPTLMKYLIEHEDSLNKDLSFQNISNSDHRIARQNSVDELSAPSEKVLQVRKKLLEFLAVCLTAMKQYSPGMLETLCDRRADHRQCSFVLEMTFQTPSMDQECPTSFGAILACVNMCFQWLTQHERSPSPSKTSDVWHHVERHLLLYVLEVGLTLLLSQGCLALMHQELPTKEKQLMRRELASELNMVMQMANRFLRRGSLSPSCSPSFPSPSRQRQLPQNIELPFMKLVNYFVNKLSK